MELADHAATLAHEPDPALEGVVAAGAEVAVVAEAAAVVVVVPLDSPMLSRMLSHLLFG